MLLFLVVIVSEPYWHRIVYFSGRSPAVANSKKRSAARDEEEDLTKEMDNPSPEPNIQEVNIIKSGNPFSRT